MMEKDIVLSSGNTFPLSYFKANSYKEDGHRPLVVPNDGKVCDSWLRVKSCRNGTPGDSRKGSKKNGNEELR